MFQSTVGIDQEKEDRSLAGWEIASVVTSLLIAEWIVLSFAGRSKLVGAIPVVLAFVFMYLSHRIHGETMREVGFRTDNFLRAAKVLFLPTLAGALLIALAGWLNGGVRYGLIVSRPRLLWLPLWALAQQYVLQGFINRRAQMFLSPGAGSVILVAGVFSLLHLPNLPLAAATFLGGLLWAAAYQRVPNLLAPAISHAVLSLLLAFSLPPAWLNSLRVGFKYFA
ncbi:MAG: CPBP family intramembrane glutamic endopeptidase [Pyrinomonadaceae bacterium]